MVCDSELVATAPAQAAPSAVYTQLFITEAQTNIAEHMPPGVEI